MADFSQRKSIRLPEFDYSQSNYYFITICTHQKSHLFGRVVNGQVVLNGFGNIINNELIKTPLIRREIDLIKYVIMPNHIHVLILINNVGASGNSPVNNKQITNWANGRSPLRMKPKSVSSFVAGYKSVTTKSINIIRRMPGCPVWQRNYYEHIIRDDDDYASTWEYIDQNPDKWNFDEEI